MYMKLKDGKSKALTLSYDDGVVQDIRFMKILDQHGIKATFNLVGSKFDQGTSALTKEYIESEILGRGHEIANHGYEHRALDVQRPIECIREILDCRLTLEREFGHIIRGFACPDRSINRFKTPDIYERVRRAMIECDLVYARSTGADGDSFALPEDWFHWVPTAHHDNPELFDYIDRFLSEDVNAQYRSRRGPRLFYLWGHAHEFENNGNWERLDKICERLSGHDEIWYATNMEIYTYVEAYRSLEYSADGLRVYNPSLLTVWFDVDGTLYEIGSGETITLAQPTA